MGMNVNDVMTRDVRVANPNDLKAELRIAETQTKDIRIGQYAEVDTRNGIVKGRVSRIDPSSVGGTVGVDVQRVVHVVGPLPVQPQAAGAARASAKLVAVNLSTVSGDERVAAAQRAFTHRAMMNSLATRGQWKQDLEKKAA